ncbi:MAG: hypothetical protein L0Y56_03800 [Nitrospira sp.]|nr:hypothetical protein [Nitrospira sp.]
MNKGQEGRNREWWNEDQILGILTYIGSIPDSEMKKVVDVVTFSPVLQSSIANVTRLCGNLPQHVQLTGMFVMGMIVGRGLEQFPLERKITGKEN